MAPSTSLPEITLPDYHHISGNRWGDERNYDLVPDSSCGVEASADKVLEFLYQTGKQKA